LNRTTLHRQALSVRQSQSIGDMASRMLVIQSQEPAAPFVALWNRVDSFDLAAADDAWRSGDLVKSTQLRVTLHSVHREDYPMVQQTMGDRLRSRMNDRRFRETGYTAEQIDAVLPELLQRLDSPKTVPEVQSVLDDLFGEPVSDGVWWAIRQFAPVVHAPTDSAWAFGQRPSFAAGPLGTNPPPRDEALTAFFLRYLDSFGPASRHDFGQFTLLKQSTIVPMIESLTDQLVEYEGPDGAMLYDVADGAIIDDQPVPPRLMAMWDSVLLAYADRSRIIPEDIRKTVIRQNGDILPTLLVDGYVAGVWQVVDGVVEAKALRSISDSDWDGLATEAADLRPLLDRDPNLFSRYRRWWPKIEALETRVLN